MVMKKLALAGSAAALVCLMSSNADASPIGGIEFPDGAISEPITMSLLGLGLAGIVARRRARS